MTISEYLDSLQKRFKSGLTTEHSFRGDLQTLIEELSPKLLVTNEPTRVSCGAPDFILTKRDSPVGYIEAKDLGDNLDDNKNLEQFERYKRSFSNLIITNYLEFRRFRNGECVDSVSVGIVTKTKVQVFPENFKKLELMLLDFAEFSLEEINSAKTLSKLMATKAKSLAFIINNSIESDIRNSKASELFHQYEAFREILLNDISVKEFSDIYSQTIVYGLFAARLYSSNVNGFDRQQAASLIPESNPFLRRLFQYIAGYDVDDRLGWLIDDLLQIFQSANILKIFKEFGNSKSSLNPIIHFYESFLQEYDPEVRKKKGVWYTAPEVVDFIVKSVDSILIQDFNVKDGLADISKTKIKIDTQSLDKRTSTRYKRIEKEVHKVQILDPAVGTGTFLASVVKHIHKKFEAKEGVWSSYVDQHLLPRLNGFEILMASYAMAHLTLDIVLRTTGYTSESSNRLKIFLTNSLENIHPEMGTLFASWLSEESREADYVKRDTPVMVVLGNPPYSVSSNNKNEWITGLVKAYKEGLNDVNIQPLSDDYIKFIRFGENLIEKNGEGILAFITNNSFIDGIIHRKMREHLLGTFDKIYILDLHGSTKRLEKSEDGEKDENVFDIQQGVSINFFIKRKNPPKNNVDFYKFDLYGKRSSKFEFLTSKGLNDIDWKKFLPGSPNFFFYPVNELQQELYQSFIPINKLFSELGAGVQTKRDDLFVDFDRGALENRIRRLLAGEFSEQELQDYKIKNSSSYRLLERIERASYNPAFLERINYRALDDRFIYYDPNLLGRAFYKTMRHMLADNNLALVVCRQQSTFNFQHASVTSGITDHNSLSLQTKEASYLIPLYVINDVEGSEGFKANLNQELVLRLLQNCEMEYSAESEEGKISPEDIFNYVLAILHSKKYRAKYSENLKSDFPRIPSPPSQEIFTRYKLLGKSLKDVHMLSFNNEAINQYSFPEKGNNRVENVKYENERVWINSTQYFNNISESVWSFYIGGFKPCEKWLKDRIGRTLGFEEVDRYQKLLLSVSEIMRMQDLLDLEEEFF